MTLAMEVRPPRREDMKRWKRRSRLIAAMRLVLPALMAAVTAALLVTVIFRTLGGRMDEAAPDSIAIRMTDARFLGRDNQGRPFIITAKEATRDDSDLTRILLQKPTLVLGQGSAEETMVLADRGVFLETKKLLQMNQNVRFVDESGYQFQTNEALVDTETAEISGTETVRGVGPTGAVQADSYTVHERGDRVIFRGRVSARLNRD